MVWYGRARERASEPLPATPNPPPTPLAQLSSPREGGGDGGGVEPSESAPPPVPSESEVAASALKDEGNAALAAGDYAQAVERYREALAVLDKEEEVVVQDEGSGFDISDSPAGTAAPGAPAQPGVVALRVALLSNAALAELKRERWAGAVDAAARALELDPENHKARFRRGTALARLGRHTEAAADLNKARRALPQDKAIRRELKQVQEALKADEEASRNRSGLAHLRKKLEDMPDDSFSMQDAMKEVGRMAKQLPTSSLKEVLEPDQG